MSREYCSLRQCGENSSDNNHCSNRHCCSRVGERDCSSLCLGLQQNNEQSQSLIVFSSYLSHSRVAQSPFVHGNRHSNALLSSPSNQPFIADVSECPFGRWGVNCENECHCRDGNESCHPVNGTCESGCAARWAGHSCQRE